MEKETVIKALECCDGTLAGCEECPNYNNRYRCKIKQDSLALINELTKENERHKSISINKDITIEAINEVIKQLNEENERLKSEVSVKKKLLDKCVDLEDRVKDDTVKRFAEKLEITLMSRLVTATKEQKAAILFCINQINQTKAIMTKPKDCLQCKNFVGCEPSTLGVCDMYEEDEKE